MENKVLTLDLKSNITTNPTILCEIMGRNKSDKGHINITSAWHNYTTVYHHLFNDIRENKLRIFELGLGTNNTSLASNMGANGRPGASLYGWCEYFPNSKIFGADIDRNILFQNDRISTYYCDQRNPEIIMDLWDNVDLKEEFDIIIEDGLHEYNANVCFFQNSIHRLAIGGYYIIEDVSNHTLQVRFHNKLTEWAKLYSNLHFSIICLPSTVNNYDNNIIVVYRMR